MPAVIIRDDHRPQGATIPDWVTDLQSFRRWADSPDFPEWGRFTYLHGVVQVDLSMEQLLVHNRLKVRVTSALDALATTTAFEYVFGDGARLHSERADVSVEPDVMCVSFDALRKGRVTLNEGAEEGFVSLEGAPDLVVEI